MQNLKFSTKLYLFILSSSPLLPPHCEGEPIYKKSLKPALILVLRSVTYGKSVSLPWVLVLSNVEGEQYQHLPNRDFIIKKHPWKYTI